MPYDPDSTELFITELDPAEAGSYGALHDRIVENTLRRTEPRQIDEGEVALVNSAALDTVVDLREPRLDRIVAAPVFAAPGSLIAYARRYDQGHTTLWHDVDRHVWTAILDGDVPTSDGLHEPAWRSHRPSLQLRRTPEWDDWCRIDRDFLGQDAFAEFLDLHRLDVADPAAADLIEIVRTMQASSQARFERRVRDTDGGIAFTWVEEVEGKAGAKGELVVPESITLLIAPFVGVDPLEVEVLLRWRVASGAASFGTAIVNRDRVEREITDDVTARLADELAVDVLEHLTVQLPPPADDQTPSGSLYSLTSSKAGR